MGRTTLAVRAATDLGLRRSENEDSHGCWIPDEPAAQERRGALMVVADGMGGSQAGEVASRLAVETVLGAYRDGHGEDALDDLRRAVVEANRAVYEQSTANPQHTGMGTTCTALVVRDREALVAHVGDSRAYLVRDGRIRQLTHDHSLVAQMVQRNEITPEQARTDPRRNVVTRSVGVSADVEVDAERVELPLEPGDTLLLCSDGLHGQVTDEELAHAASGPDLDVACRELIGLANQRGGPDNITVMLARVEGLEGTREFASVDRGRRPVAQALGREGRRSSRAMVLWLALAVMVLLLTLAGIWWLMTRMSRDTEALDRAVARPSAPEATWA
jgi:protein phosphatase